MLNLQLDELSEFTARYLNDKTAFMENLPKGRLNWDYLQAHGERLDQLQALQNHLQRVRD